MEGILDKLQMLKESDFYPYHMPGHKRYGNSCFALDITEIDGFDNLHHATGMIKEAQEKAAQLYGSEESFFLVNGSTCGLLVAIFASFQKGDTVLVARNCHKAVYHAIELRGITPVYLYPETDDEYNINVGIKAFQVRDALEAYREKDGFGNNISGVAGKIKGMILTSPTYEGLVSEVKEIADLLHSQDMILIVDEAHGAHFGFHEDFPARAVNLGADLVIQSMHKTLPSMTQTALLHRCSERVARTKVQKYLGVFQTSSPSYVFMAYMDECIRMLSKQGKEVFDVFAGRLKGFYHRCKGFKGICVRQPEMLVGKKRIYAVSDPGKIVISAPGRYSGKELYNILRNRYHLQPEMCAGTYVLAIMTVCDTEDGFERLYEALAELDRECVARGSFLMNEDVVCQEEQSDTQKIQYYDIKTTLESLAILRPVANYNPAEAEGLQEEVIRFADAAGKVSKEYIYLYPPGIPYIVPGEVICNEMVEGLSYLQSHGYELRGLADDDGEYVRVAVSE